MYDHNVPRCTTEHLRRVLRELGTKPAATKGKEMKAQIEAELKRRASLGEATLKTYRRG